MWKSSPKKRWSSKKVNKELVSALQKELKVAPVFCELLVQRGITTFEEARLFFRPDLKHLHDPFLMMDMPKAIKRIELAIEKKEKILVYGDYDVDGTTSVSLVYSFFKEIYDHIDYYIPDRYKEGYGISKQGIDYAETNNCGLIIALDCGIKAHKEVEYASKKKIDFIICDHHLPADTLPNAYAVLDPKRPDCSYPYKELSGCGVGFKLIDAYAQKHNITFEKVTQYLDLLAVSIACDIVPITGENRILAYYGLELLRQNPRIGLRKIMDLAGLTHYAPLTIDDLVFKIGPRINAAGRIGHATEAVNVLISETSDDMQDASLLDYNNQKRKGLDADMLQEALEIISTNEQYENQKSTVVFQSHWHKGVVGIVASRLIERYYRPTIVLTESNGMITGSARSVLDYDIHEAIGNCSDLLEQFGGHKYAAGLTLKKENLDAFSNRFEEIVRSSISEELLIPEISIDAELNLDDLTISFYNILKQFGPFGPGNMKPIFISKRVQKDKEPRLLKSEHLKLSVCQPPSKTYDAIGFGMGHFYSLVQDNPSFDICYQVEENNWNNIRSLQLMLKDIR